MPRFYAEIYAPYEEYEALDRGADRIPPRPFEDALTVIQQDTRPEDTRRATIVEIVVDGPTTAEVHKEAVAVYAQLRECAGLDPVADPGPIAYIPINALLHLDTKSSRFFRFAEQLFDEGQFVYTVVAVQTAFELYLEGVFDYLLSLRTPHAVGAAVEKFLTQKYSLSRDEVRELLEALISERIADTRELQEYKKHLKRRNGLVHRGERLGREEARASLTAVQELVAVISSRVRIIMPKPSEMRPGPS